MLVRSYLVTATFLGSHIPPPLPFSVQQDLESGGNSPIEETESPQAMSAAAGAAAQAAALGAAPAGGLPWLQFQQPCHSQLLHPTVAALRIGTASRRAGRGSSSVPVSPQVASTGSGGSGCARSASPRTFIRVRLGAPWCAGLTPGSSVMLGGLLPTLL